MGAVKLTYEDKHSVTWARVKQFVEEEIDLLRKRNDGPLDMEATQRLRGQIAALKKVLDLDSEMPVVDSHLGD
jgi:hypothetical protein